MPRLVVPIWRSPSRRSLPWSIATCQGMIRCASPETRTQPVEIPRSSSSSSSRTKTSGSITQPAPRMHSLPCRIPDGMWWNLNFSPPVTIVCPAFGPPW